MLSVIWRAGGLLFATGIDAVAEVLSPLACTPTPGVPQWVRGLFNYRGRLIPLVDVARLLARSPSPDRMINRVVVVRSTPGTAALDSPVGLWVEAVLEPEALDFDGAGMHPGFATEAGRFLGPVVETGWGQVQLVHPQELFTAEQASVLAERLKEAAA